jgi:GlpG protein
LAWADGRAGPLDRASRPFVIDSARDPPLRQIGTLPKGLAPKVFADHLLALQIKARIDERPEGSDVWIYNEDQVARAREELQVYLSQPDDPRFRNAVPAAQAVRRQQKQLDKQFRKNFREVTDLWAAPGFRRRPLTVALIATCVIVYLFQRSEDGFQWENRLFFTSFYVDREGALRDNGLEPILHGEVWRMVTPIFMHSTNNLLHILFNMMCLNAFGTMIEVRRGTLRLAGLVLIAAVISNFGEYFYDIRAHGHAVPSLGFSGVGYALFGYIWMKGLHEPEQGMAVHPNTVNIMMLWLVVCMTGWLGPIANAAHVMGLVVGVTLGVFRY